MQYESVTDFEFDVYRHGIDKWLDRLVPATVAALPEGELRDEWANVREHRAACRELEERAGEAVEQAAATK